MSLHQTKVFRLLKAGVAVLGIAIAGASSADPFPTAPTVLTLSDTTGVISGYPSPYATVSYFLLDDNTARFTFASEFPYLFGAVNSAALNFSGAVSLFGAITGNSTCPAPYTAGAGNVSEFGDFNFTIRTFNGANCASSSISFTVDLISGIWADNAAILTPNNNGFLAAAHIFAGCTGTPPNRSCVNTGFVGNGDGGGGPPQEIPEPQTLALLGLGLFGLAFMRRRYKA